jgi:hypothetical protein
MSVETDCPYDLAVGFPRKIVLAQWHFGRKSASTGIYFHGSLAGNCCSVMGLGEWGIGHKAWGISGSRL